MKLKYTRPQIILEIAGIALLAGMVVYIALSRGSYPDRIPTHFNAAGQADGWGSISDLLFMPIMGLCLYALITVLTFFPGVWNMNIGSYREENKQAVYQTVKTMMIALKIEMVAVFFSIFYFQSIAQNLPSWFLALYLAVVAASIVLFILRARRVGNREPGEY